MCPKMAFLFWVGDFPSDDHPSPYFSEFVLFHRQASCVLLINASADGRRWLVAGSLGDLYLLHGFELPSLKINSKSP